MAHKNLGREDYEPYAALWLENERLTFKVYNFGKKIVSSFLSF